MNQLIGWLLQPTQNGATYLQVLIMGVLMLIVMRLLINTIKEVIDINRGDGNDNKQSAKNKEIM